MAGQEGGVRLAVVAVGATAVGIEMAAVAQALPLPERLAALPRRGGALAGVADCDGVPLPLVDLARWVDVGTAPPGALRRILVLCEGARRIGLLVDGIDGFADVPESALAPLHRDADPDEVFETMATVPSTGAMLAVLATGRLMALACAWQDGDATAAEAAPAAEEVPADERIDCAVLRAGHALLALPTVHLAGVEPLPAVGRVGAAGTAFCTWRGRHVPVVDGCVAVAGGVAAPARQLLAVVEHDGRLLGIAIDAALDMRALPAPGPDIPTIYDGAEALSFVAVEALFARYPETALSVTSSAAAIGQGAPGGNPVPLLVFDAGGPLAIALDAVEQVLPGTSGVVQDTMPWQGRAIGVADLRRADGAGHVLVVRHGETRVACAVDGVRSLVPAGAGRPFTLGQPGRGAARYIEAADGERQASYRIVDAEELARAVRGG